ncbi:MULTISPECIES: DUF3017 domain-containing protein [Actinoalloteichus]|uniref:DUF3017 family protein n=1 Tax=Actinoalloteichus fjordicus TaxID=1612552 RepID=A0AAC9LH06_9PSEU|nr:MULTISPECIES: DUF3017 domain-containing protein [Actinoalloteichus]APU17521.1 putative DUF3017 family protein [Actinoalloteichus fjordicus]APU23598.1 putative DUF3017 family protein [Actinoalloteichus sp. GBA129-24]
MNSRGRDHVGTSQLSFLLVLAIVVFGFVRVTMGYWREGAALVGFALLLAAGLRVLLSDEQAGLLKIRGSGVDMLCYGVLGTLVLFVSLTIEGGPFG